MFMKLLFLGLFITYSFAFKATVTCTSAVSDYDCVVSYPYSGPFKGEDITPDVFDNGLDSFTPVSTLAVTANTVTTNLATVSQTIANWNAASLYTSTFCNTTSVLTSYDSNYLTFDFSGDSAFPTAGLAVSAMICSLPPGYNVTRIYKYSQSICIQQTEAAATNWLGGVLVGTSGTFYRLPAFAPDITISFGYTINGISGTSVVHASANTTATVSLTNAVLPSYDNYNYPYFWKNTTSGTYKVPTVDWINSSNVDTPFTRYNWVNYFGLTQGPALDSARLCQNYIDRNQLFCERSSMYCASGTPVIKSTPVWTENYMAEMPSNIVIDGFGHVILVAPTKNLTGVIKYTVRMKKTPPSVKLTGFTATCEGFVLVKGFNSGNGGVITVSIVYNGGFATTKDVNVNPGTFEIALESTLISKFCYMGSCLPIEYDSCTPKKAVLSNELSSNSVGESNQWFNVSGDKTLFWSQVFMVVFGSMFVLLLSMYLFRNRSMFSGRWGRKSANYTL